MWTQRHYAGKNCPPGLASPQTTKERSKRESLRLKYSFNPLGLSLFLEKRNRGWMNDEGWSFQMKLSFFTGRREKRSRRE